MDANGAVALITGASRGIGATIAERLAAGGSDVALLARSCSALDSVCERLERLGVRALPVECDLSDASSIRPAVDRVEAELGPIDILINNAGRDAPGSLESLDSEVIEDVVAVNLTAALLLTRAVLPGMSERDRGHVVNVSSLAGKTGTPMETVYSATKFALVGMARSLRSEHFGTNVGFSVVCPTFVSDVGMFARLLDSYQQAEQMPLAVSLIPKTTAGRVADGVMRAINSGGIELIISERPMRPLIALGELFPGLAARVWHYTGATRTFRDHLRSGEA